MYQAGKDEYKVDGYIFSRKKLGDGNTLIVAISSEMNEDVMFFPLSELRHYDIFNHFKMLELVFHNTHLIMPVILSSFS